MIKFIHAADVHLDSPFTGLEQYEGLPLDQIKAATRHALENLVRLALEESVDFVLISGDLYDGNWKDHRTGLFFVRQMAQLREAGIRCFLIQGNHDAQSKITKSLRVPEGIRWFSVKQAETVMLEDLGVAIHGQGFSQQHVYENLSDAYPSAVCDMFNIGMLHTCGDGVEGHERYAPCTLDGLKARGYQYWALGHVHQRRPLCDAPHVHFPGNTQGRHINEAGAKGCLLVTVDDADRPNVSFKALDTFRWARCNVDIGNSVSIDDALDCVGQSFRASLSDADDHALIVRVTVIGRCDASEKLLARQNQFREEVRALSLDLGGGMLWLERIEQKLDVPGASLNAGAADGPLGELLEFLRNIGLADVTSLREELEPLLNKLPHELHERGDLNFLNEEFGEFVKGTESVLLDRLLRSADSV